MRNEIWALVEVSGGRVLRVSAEALSEAVRQATQARGSSSALVVGQDPDDRLLKDILSHGPDRVLVLQNEADLGVELPPSVDDLERLIRSRKPSALLLGNTAAARDFAPRLAARLPCPLATEVSYLNPQGALTLFTRPAFRPHASMILRPRLPGFHLVLLASGAMDIEKPGPKPGAAVERVSSTLPFEQNPVRVLESVREIASAVDLADAEVIVAGGRGMQSQEHFLLLSELAEVLGGTVGASRMAVDAKWCSRDRMVGVTGKIVAPELYIACGISGAVQHVMGMKGARSVIAINTDPTAPIFKIATLGILGDAREVLPPMIAALRKARASRESMEARP